MKETYAMYYDAPYKREFDAHLVAQEESDRGFRAVLDRTLFYPEGGGQPADTGTLEGVRVLDVRKNENGIITHVLEQAPPRMVMHGVIDWSRRYDYMQQHTGQHLISSALLETGGFNTVSVHFGEDLVTIETDAAGITQDRLLEAEDLVNRIICENRPISTSWITDEEIPDYPFRRPPAVSGRIRIVRIEDFDCAACGGLHVESTGEVRLVHLIRTEKIRGHARSWWKIGDRALRDYRLKTDVTSSLSILLSAPAQDLERKTHDLQEALKKAQAETFAAHGMRALLAADRMLSRSRALSSYRLVTSSFAGEHPVFMKKIGEALSVSENCIALVLNRTGKDLHWIIVLPTGTPIVWEELRSTLLPAIHGKGGGKPPLYQGGGTLDAGEDEGAALASAFEKAFENFVTARFVQE